MHPRAGAALIYLDERCMQHTCILSGQPVVRGLLLALTSFTHFRLLLIAYKTRHRVFMSAASKSIQALAYICVRPQLNDDHQ